MTTDTHRSSRPSSKISCRVGCREVSDEPAGRLEVVVAAGLNRLFQRLERNMNGHTRTLTLGYWLYRRIAPWLMPVTAAAFLAQTTYADNFAKVYFDKKTDRLVV